MKKIAWILLIVGGINWGLVAIGNFIGSNLDVVNLIFGGGLVANIVYLLVGISAIACVSSCCCTSKTCRTPKKDMNMNQGQGGSMNM
jgi:uncharacterized membrane protein YuzA (DUF378 family)